ncbi:MAG TPA: SRPBCC domain-containing protein [Chthonomonadales bacterium]|nr:SRPBCC domain-containing protein [Chthonomonadales bacterium]
MRAAYVYADCAGSRFIQFTWNGACGAGEEVISEVTVELAPTEAGTRLTLTHNRLANSIARDTHATGWVGCLTGLGRYATGN